MQTEKVVEHHGNSVFVVRSPKIPSLDREQQPNEQRLLGTADPVTLQIVIGHEMFEMHAT